MQVEFIRKHVIKNIHLNFVEEIFMLIRGPVFVRLIYWASAARRSNFNKALNLSALQR